MSSEIQKYNEKNLEREKKFFNAEVINFPEDKRSINTKNLPRNDYKVWKLYDKTNENEDDDQLKAVIGICSMIGALVIMGLFSTFI